MSKGTTRRTVRIEDGLWEDAKAKAEADEQNLSEVIRQLLTEWIAK
jgi:predicted DNA-binding ribbon-helix-helix protein